MTYTHDQILPKGTHIGVYEIQDKKETTAFDITYRAWNHHLKEQVEILEYFPQELALRTDGSQVIECKLPSNKEDYDLGLRAFLDLGNVLTHVEHPNIATAENILEHNGTAYLIMHRYEGKSLSRMLESSIVFEETEIKFILISILNALKKLHECNFIHGGIQPTSIFLKKDGEPILMCFLSARQVIAKRLSEDVSALITAYSPVEQYELVAETGPATDFYSLGATLYRCISNQEPVSAQERLNAINRGESDPLISLSELPGLTLSLPITRAIDWMLKLHYSDRPQSVVELMALIDKVITKDQVQANIAGVDAIDGSDKHKITKSGLGLAIGVSIAAFIVIGLWFSEKKSDWVEEREGIDTAEITESILPNERHAKDLDNDQSSKISPRDSFLPSDSSLEDEDHKVESATVESEVKGNQQPIMANLPAKESAQPLADDLIDKSVIKLHLNAAEKAMRASRFTTPAKDNAFKHYQMVLAIDAHNDIAQAGLRRIVDRYIQFIAKARLEGRMADVQLYLDRAESVLPDDVRLEKIRLELETAAH
ncbi:MAG: protein kinase [Nitrosomonas sp.]|nr:protein kinase [Nitrosomonas sp.]